MALLIPVSSGSSQNEVDRVVADPSLGFLGVGASPESVEDDDGVWGTTCMEDESSSPSTLVRTLKVIEPTHYPQDSKHPRDNHKVSRGNCPRKRSDGSKMTRSNESYVMDAMIRIFNSVLAPREEKLAESPVRRVVGRKWTWRMDVKEKGRMTIQLPD
ncbi:hypothetical protein B296_00032844 [Ensete ventricosum]|uniref:Uncharacterized protein n=1 Tax=Ensete ventricosum TaxID=4639 RepID=A0A426Z1X8_ENSVE|nr:hypothetical protein B296_00032844 [Ensete ventricosum]